MSVTLELEILDEDPLRGYDERGFVGRSEG
jgi:hypothetical protein